jgi:hypothetical protein
MVMIDLPKLFFKIQHCGIDGHLFDWLESVLVGRALKMKVNSDFSHSFSASSGVGQSTVIGPSYTVLKS